MKIYRLLESLDQQFSLKGNESLLLINQLKLDGLSLSIAGDCDVITFDDGYIFYAQSKSSSQTALNREYYRKQAKAKFMIVRNVKSQPCGFTVRK